MPFLLFWTLICSSWSYLCRIKYDATVMHYHILTAWCFPYDLKKLGGWNFLMFFYKLPVKKWAAVTSTAVTHRAPCITEAVSTHCGLHLRSLCGFPCHKCCFFDTIFFLSREYICIKDGNKSLFYVCIVKAAIEALKLCIWREIPSSLVFSPAATKNYLANKCIL